MLVSFKKQTLMKKTLLLVAFAFASITTFAQKGTGFGIKAGLNYNQNGDLNFTEVQNAGENILEGSDGKVGFHVGIYGKLDFPKVYIKPELVYTKTKSSYSIANSSTDYDISRIDLPVLIGYKLVGPLHVFIGPAFQYTVDNKLKDVELEDLKSDFTVGLNVGVGVSLGSIGLDVRYERGFSKNEASFINNNIAELDSGRVDSRPSQITFGLSLKL